MRPVPFNPRREVLFNFFFVMFKRKYFIVAVSLLIFLAVLFGTYLKTPLYKATAKVLVDIKPKQQLIIFPDLLSPGERNLRVAPSQNLISILTSQSIAQEIVRKFQLDERLRERVTAPVERRDVIKKALIDFLKSPLAFAQRRGWLETKEKDFFALATEKFLEEAEDIEVESDTSVILVKIWEESPELAAAIANTMVELLREKLLALSRKEAESAYLFVKAKLEGAEKDLRKAEDALGKFKRENQILLMTEEERARVQRVDVLKAELSDLRAQLAALLKEKTTYHPDVVALDARIKEKEKTLENLQRELLLIPEREKELVRLTRSLETYQNLVTSLRAKLEELRIQKETPLSEIGVGVIDGASLPPDANPDSPKWGLVILVGMVVSLGIGLGLAFFRDYWDDTFRIPEEVERFAQLPVLGVIPEYRRVKKEKRAYEEKRPSPKADSEHPG